MQALIVGAGAVGRWVAELLEGQVAFADVDSAAAESAATSIGDRATTVPMDTDADFELVVVAVPMRVATQTIEAFGPRASTAIVDLTGSMVEPLDAMAAAAPGVERASFHPLFAPDHAPGRVAVSEGSAGPAIGALRERFEAAGNEIVEVEPSVHDQAMETIQGRAHAAILAFGLAAEPVPDELSTPVFEELSALLNRVTDGSPGVYADIQATFDGARDIERAAGRLADADRAEFEAFFDDAG